MAPGPSQPAPKAGPAPQQRRAASASSGSISSSGSSSRSSMRRRRGRRAFSRRRPRRSGCRSRRSSPSSRRPSASRRRASRSRGRSPRRASRSPAPSAPRIRPFEEPIHRVLGYKVALLQGDMESSCYDKMMKEAMEAFSCGARKFGRLAGPRLTLQGYKIYWVRKMLHQHWPEAPTGLMIVAQQKDLIFVAVGVDPPPHKASKRRAWPKRVAPPRAPQASSGSAATPSRAQRNAKTSQSVAGHAPEAALTRAAPQAKAPLAAPRSTSVPIAQAPWRAYPPSASTSTQTSTITLTPRGGPHLEFLWGQFPAPGRLPARLGGPRKRLHPGVACVPARLRLGLGARCGSLSTIWFLPILSLLCAPARQRRSF